MQQSLRLLLVSVILAWAPAHAGFLDKLFNSPTASSNTAPPVAGTILTPAAYPVLLSQVSDYRLGAGDKLGITVFNEKELSMEVLLSDAGTFLYPFLGEIAAKNKTIGELKSMLTQQLKDGYLVDPKVYVSIIEYRPFFVNGEVSKPGGYPYQPGLTIRKAISLAGGLTPRASLAKIFVIHENDPTGVPRLANLDTVIVPGDIVTVDQSFF
ncbi:polysaccharide biosynthesis/export family protein [Agitococcus lubricus]|uniref:Polysaccharide export outer membrane protein n=1 Tax=Agitococcus lubricus TaxID=1077255 RepID=A0A2T5IYK4_9GAMM|nr:polysaccharide biosynthesis/export family protein [Agitococcus lubricus]PTQ89078.1 polysaccharide export outer membrane protein [Agitococcus lubricus]